MGHVQVLETLQALGDNASLEDNTELARIQPMTCSHIHEAGQGQKGRRAKCFDNLTGEETGRAYPQPGRG
jgi:hypothetical protein